jgi:hypothetical protein
MEAKLETPLDLKNLKNLIKTSKSFKFNPKQMNISLSRIEPPKSYPTTITYWNFNNRIQYKYNY